MPSTPGAPDTAPGGGHDGPDAGTFFCPTCGGDRRYVRRRPLLQRRTWFRPRRPAPGTLELLRCGSCASDHPVSALQEPTNATIAEAVALALRHAIVALLRAAPGDDPGHRVRCVSAVAARLGAPGLDHDALVVGLRSLDDAFLRPVCARAGRLLSPPGRRHLVWTCLEVAGADGFPSPAQLAVVRRVGDGLGCPPEDVQDLIRLVHRSG